MTLVSRLLGVVRDHFQARFFGTTILAEYWEIAYMLPNLLRNLLAEGILSQSFIPVYSESLKVSQQKANQDSGKIIIFLTIVLFFIIVIGIISFPFLLPYYVGKPKQEIELLIHLSQILFPFIGFISLTSLFSGILYTHQKFIVPSLSPIILNLDFIFTFVVFLLILDWIFIPLQNIAYFLAIAVILGSIFVLLVQVYFVYREGWLPDFQFAFREIKNIYKDPIIKKLFFLVGPAVLGASIFQLNQLIDIFLASYFVKIEGAIPALRFSHRLIQLPTGIIGVALSTTILPVLTSYIRKNESSQIIGEEIVYSIRFSLFLTLPASLGLFILGPYIVHFLFSGGLWNIYSTYITLWSLQFYVLGIPFYSINKILTSSFYAYQDTKTPVKILFFVVVINLILNILFIPFLQHGGLAISTSISAILNSLLLFYNLNKNIPIPFSILFQFLKYIIWILCILFLYLMIIDSYFSFPYEEKRFSLEFILNNQIENIKLPERMECLEVLAYGIGGSLLLYFLFARFYLYKEYNIIRSVFNKKTSS